MRIASLERVNTFTIASTHGTAHLATTNVTSGTGIDKIFVQTIDGPTNIKSGGGDDTIFVGTTSVLLTSTLNAIKGGYLTIDGQDGADTVIASDGGDAANNSGKLTSTELTGLGLILGIRYTAEFLEVQLGTTCLR